MSDQSPVAGKELVEPMELAGSVSRPMEEMVAIIINRHIEQLAKNDLEYLTAAAWGYSPRGRLDEAQSEIYESVQGVVGQALAKLSIGDLSSAQEFTLNYLIRALVVAKFCHAVEMYRSSLYREALYHVAREDRCRHLESLKVVGRA